MEVSRNRDFALFPAIWKSEAGNLRWSDEWGAGNRARTDDLLITNQLLYQLSYAGIYAPTVAWRFAGDKRSPVVEIRERASIESDSVASNVTTVLT